MNFLAHAIFADGPPDVLFGAVANDWMNRTTEVNQLNQQIRDGRTIHNRLDEFFDTTNLLAPCRKQLFGLIRHMQNPVFDICSDYIIGSNWNSLFSIELEHFVLQIHDILIPRIPLLSQQRQLIAHAFIEENWLLSYRELTGLKGALDRLAYRVGERGSIIMDKREEIINTVPYIRPLLLAAVPYIRQFTRDSMFELGYDDAEIRLHWKEALPLKETYGSIDRRI